MNIIQNKLKMTISQYLEIKMKELVKKYKKDETKKKMKGGKE